MAAMQGVVSRVSVKSVDADQFGNDKLKSFQLEGGDVWYGLGKSKGDTINIKKGTGYQPLEAGDSVEFFYETSNSGGKTYYNTKSSKITITGKGSGAAPAPQPQQQKAQAAPQQSAQPAAQARSAGGGSKPGYEAGIKVGHAINNAVQLVCAEDGVPTLAAIERKAIAILKLSRKMEFGFESIFDGTYVPMEEKKAEPAQQPAKEEKKPARTSRKAAEAAKPTLPPEPQVQGDTVDHGDDGGDVDPGATDDAGDNQEPPAQQGPASVMDFSDDIPF